LLNDIDLKKNFVRRNHSDIRQIEGKHGGIVGHVRHVAGGIDVQLLFCCHHVHHKIAIEFLSPDGPCEKNNYKYK